MTCKHLLGASLAVAVAALPSAAHAATCTPSRVMVLLDRSSSMDNDTINGMTKWSIATSALNTVVGDYQGDMEFGLMMFPTQAASCAGASLFVTPALNALTPISTALNTPRLYNAYTPIGEALVNTVSQPSLNVSGMDRYVILITDGHEDCPSGTPIMASAAIVSKVTALTNAGIKTFVVGFGQPSNGDGVDAYTLNQMAVAGQTAQAGCDPTGASPTSPNLCYYQADNDAALIAALNAIVNQIVTRTCSTACGDGTQTCSQGVWTDCNAPQPQPEICDGVDNNCDGTVDEGCDCQDGQTQSCGQVGQCAGGTQVCTNGHWGACVPGPGAQPTACDADCDGNPDSGCVCIPGTTRTCGGPNVGQCKTGTETCDSNGQWGSCMGAVGPTPEVCDGVDNNCDGTVDENTQSEGDDVPRSLCDANQQCVNGMCVAVAPPPPKAPAVSPETGDVAGCGCTVGGPGVPVGGALMLIALAALVLVRRRK